MSQRQYVRILNVLAQQSQLAASYAARAWHHRAIPWMQHQLKALIDCQGNVPASATATTGQYPSAHIASVTPTSTHASTSPTNVPTTQAKSGCV